MLNWERKFKQNMVISTLTDIFKYTSFINQYEIQIIKPKWWKEILGRKPILKLNIEIHEALYYAEMILQPRWNIDKILQMVLGEKLFEEQININYV